MEDFFYLFGTITQRVAPEIGRILDRTGTNPEIASVVEVIRTVGAITQSVVSHANKCTKQIEEEIPIDENTEIGFNAETVRTTGAITKVLFSHANEILEEIPINRDTDSALNTENINGLQTFTESIFSNAAKMLENPVSSQNTAATADSVQTVCQVEANIQSTVSVNEGIAAEDFTDPVVVALHGLKFVTQSVVSATKTILEEMDKEFGNILTNQDPLVVDNVCLARMARIAGKVTLKIMYPIGSTESGFFKLLLRQNSESDNREDFDGFVFIINSLYSNIVKKLEEFPSNKITGTTPVVDIIHRIGHITELPVTFVEGVLENAASEELNGDTQSGLETLRVFKSENQSVVSEFTNKLEEIMTDVQGNETVLSTREVFPVGTYVDIIIQQFDGDENSAFKIFLSYSREVIGLLIGGLSFGYLGQTGATISGIISGILFDLIHSKLIKPKGVWTLTESNTPEDMKNAAMTMALDGLVGYIGGRFIERWIRSSEIDAMERVLAERARLGLTTPLAKKRIKEIWTEIVDRKTGKRYYGTNKKIRKILQLEEANPNLYVKKYEIEKDLPIEREAETCAEMHAFHQMLEDRPDADVSKTPVYTFEFRVDGTVKNITRCKNCMTRELYMGIVPTDKLITDENALPQKGPSREFHKSYLPTPLWYCFEHTILIRAEYNKRIKQAILVYRNLKDKFDQN